MRIEKLAIYIMCTKFAKIFNGYFINFKTMPANRKKGLVLEFGLQSANFVLQKLFIRIIFPLRG
jgi:hypothetical protein